MFRILIVDDERIVLNGIRMMIEEGLGPVFPMDIVTASNVPQAIELFDSFHPDLILTDIRMPVMDGFELIRHVRENKMSTSIVILTSHADFSYAQQAIRFNVLDFILKPIDQQVLENTIRSIWQEKQEKERTSLHTTMIEVRNMMIYGLLAQELISDSKRIDQLFPYTYFTVIVLSLDEIEEAYVKILEKILLRYYNSCYCFWLQEKRELIAICNHAQFRVQMADLKKEFMNTVHCADFCIGISISSSSYKALHNLYINAVQRLFYTKHFGANSILTDMSLFTYQDCVRIFQENEDTVIVQLLQEYFTKIKAASDSPNTPEMIYQSFVHNICLYLENNHIVCTDQINTACQVTDHQALISEIVIWMKKLKSSIQKNYDNHENDGLAKQLLGYIRQHYQEDISLDDLAAHVGLHPNYVCTVFKKNIGRSYLACLHKERLEAAKKMLRETDYTMEQIADEVGYNSASQLARVFRKYEGVSPSMFRNIIETR